MRFELVDRITQRKPGESMQAVKVLSLAEEYLQDHFPSRPVMPGVLMVEAMVQTCAWMVRLETDFAPSIVVLKEARGVRYGQFVNPGDVLRVEVTLLEMKDGLADFKGCGSVDGREVVRGRLALQYFSLADEDPRLADIDASIRREMRRRCDVLLPPDAGRTVTASSDTEAD